MTLAGMGLRICSMTSRAIFLSLISVGCTGLTLAAISLPLVLNVSDFEGLDKGNFIPFSLKIALFL
jgi:hypothetical protein